MEVMDVTSLILSKFYLCGKDCDRDKGVACDEERCHGWRPLWRASLSRVSLPAERKVGKLSCIIEHHDDKCDEKIEHHDDNGSNEKLVFFNQADQKDTHFPY